ncbi:MAG: response regulator transcription factor [Ktedonobacterales bacterium]
MSSLSSPGSLALESTASLPIVVATYDRAIGRMIVMALRLAGYAPHLYANGEQAMEAILRGPCAAAILDAHLGKVDGLTICGRVRDTTSVASVPILLVLMHDDASLQARGSHLGINTFLFMPFEVSELLAAVAAMVAVVHSPLDGHAE